MSWQKQYIRDRSEYRQMKCCIDDALDGYWNAVANENYNETMAACEKIVLTSFRLLKYFRNEVGGLVQFVDTKKIEKDVNDVVIGYYCLEGSSYQDESDVLEILSRTAYREMKITKRAKEILDGQ